MNIPLFALENETTSYLWAEQKMCLYHGAAPDHCNLSEIAACQMVQEHL